MTRDSAAPISPWPELSAAGGRRGSDQRYSTNPPQFSATIQIIFNQVKVVVGLIEEKVSNDAMEKFLNESSQKNRPQNLTNPSGSKDVVPCQSCCSLDALWPCSKRLHSLFAVSSMNFISASTTSNGDLQQLCTYFCKNDGSLLYGLGVCIKSLKATIIKLVNIYLVL